MADLGAFGAALKELTGETDHFTFQGKRFEVITTLSPWLAMKLMATGSGSVSEDAAAAALVQTFSAALGEEQYPEFDRLAVRCDQDEIIRLATSIFAAQADRPTEEPAGSSPGLLSTSPSSSSESSPFQASGPVLPPVVLSVAPQVTGDTRPDEILSTSERIARMRPVADLLTG